MELQYKVSIYLEASLLTFALVPSREAAKWYSRGFCSGLSDEIVDRLSTEIEEVTDDCL